MFYEGDKIAIASYPRSGNTLIRKIIERITKTLTGSDARPDRLLVKQLIDLGMKGEGVVDDTVWCVKTHFPERLGYVKLNAHRAIVLVRNPFDAIMSSFHLLLTEKHDGVVADEKFRDNYLTLFEDYYNEVRYGKKKKKI